MSLVLFLAELWAFEVVFLKKLILRKMHLKFWNVHSLKQLPHSEKFILDFNINILNRALVYKYNKY